jgi:hypothetical chaperone protein
MASSPPLLYAIDFGTSNSLLAAADRDRVYPPVPLDPAALDPTVLRSILYFPSMSRCYYGTEAITEFGLNPGRGRLVRSIKKYLPTRSFVGTWIEDRPANLEDLIGFFLREMKARADRHFGRPSDRVVLGRPARFAREDSDDRFAEFRLERAALNAGFREVIFCPEPIAAAFDFKQQLSETKTALVADFGGGTSDFTVIRIGPQPFHPRDVLAIGGISQAGDALDGTVMRNRLSRHFGADVAYAVPYSQNVLRMPAHLMARLCSAADIALLSRRDTQEFLRNVQKWALTGEDKLKIDRLFCLVDEQLGFPVFESIEVAKRQLSERLQANLEFRHPAIAIEEVVKREELESYFSPVVEQITATLDETVKASGVGYDQIDLVCCTGGTARVPLLQRELVRRFGERKIQERNHFHSIVHGLARRAQQIQQEGIG